MELMTPQQAKAAMDAGVATVLNIFNEINDVPATISVVLQRTSSSANGALIAASSAIGA